MDITELFGPAIHTYTRADAIADGTLVDVTETAREAGIKFPCAVTAAVWAACVEVPPGVPGQDQRGRLWDVIWMLRAAMPRCDGDTIRYRLYVRNSKREKLDRRDLVELKAVCGPGDYAEPVITIMQPDED